MARILRKKEEETRVDKSGNVTRGGGGAVVCFDLGCRKYSRRGTLVLHRAIDTSQLKCDVCPLFELYNVFCSPTRVERCWTAHERSTEKKVDERYGNSTFFQLTPRRIRAEPSNHCIRVVASYAAGLFRNEEGRAGRKHRSLGRLT